MNNPRSNQFVLMIAFLVVNPVLAEQLSDSRNLHESIVVEGYEGETVEMTAVETVRARTTEGIDQARDEVEILILKREGEIELDVDGPFRCRDERESGNCWSHWHDRYEVIYDFRVRVPHGADPFLRNIDRQYLRPQGDDRKR